MSSSGVNVLRYSALITGIFYGVYHQSTLNVQQKLNDANRKWKAEESLINKAKAEYTKKTTPRDNNAAGRGVILDANDPKFNLEAYLTMNMADRAK